MSKHTRFLALIMSVMMCLGSLQTPVWAAADRAGIANAYANAAADPTPDPTAAQTTAPQAAAEITAEAAAREATVGAAAANNAGTATDDPAAATAAELAAPAEAADNTGAATDDPVAATAAAEAAAAKAALAAAEAPGVDEATGDNNDEAAASDDAATTDGAASAETTLSETDLPEELVGDESTAGAAQGQTPEETVTPTPTPGGTWGSIKWNLANNNKRLVITGSGEMPDATDAPWQTDELRSTITEIRTGNYITSIGANAFAGFNKMTTFKFGLKIRTVGDSAFENCTKLRTINNTSTKLTTIGNRAFADCESLSEAFLPSTLVSIGKEAFYSCGSIRTVMMLSNVKTVGDSAFAYCAGLNHAFVPQSVTTVGDNIFMGCNGPMSASIDSYIVGEGMFSGCSGLYSVTIGADVIGIGMYAFRNCISLKEVYIPSGATAIGDNAFEGCLELETVTLEEGVTHICKYAFYNAGLTSLTLPSSVEFVGAYAFANCSELRTANLASKTLTNIAEYAFSRDLRLTDVTLGDELTIIGNNAFEYCSSLVNINFPEKLETIGDKAFIYNYALKTVKTGAAIREIGRMAFYSCSNLEKVTAGRGTETIGDQAFAFCNVLSSFTALSRTMTYKGDSVFRNCPVVIFGYYGSTSETYAEGHDITFESVTNMGAPVLRVCTSVRTGVSLKWNAVSGAVNYHVYRMPAGETTETLVATTNTLAYLDTGIVSGSVYTYYIVADDGTVTSEASERRTVAFVPAPKTVTSKNTLNGMQVTWAAVANADKYVIYRKSSTGSYEIIAKVKSTTRTYYDTKAVNGTTYTYAVSAYIEKFGGQVRNITGAMREARAYMRLTTPTIATVTTPSAGTMIVSWGQVDKVRGYQVKYSTDPAFAKDVTSVTIAGRYKLSKTFTGLESGKKYYVRVLSYQKDSTRYYFSGNSYKKNVVVK